MKAVNGSGAAVTAQLPNGGAKIAAGSEIILYCDEQPSTEQVAVPNLLGLSYQVARNWAGWDDLYVRGEGTMLNSSIIMTVSQDPAEGTLVDRGTVITVTLNDSTKLTIW